YFRKERLLSLDTLLLRDVTECDGEDALAADIELRNGRIGRELFAVFTQTKDRAAPLAHLPRRHLSHRKGLHILAVNRPKTLRDQHAERSPDGLRLRVAEGLL